MPPKKKRPPRDPAAAREANRYANPIASRELLLTLLGEESAPPRFEELAERLGYADEERRVALQRRLQAMERDGQVIRNRREGYGPARRMDLIRGRVQAHPDGYGFLIPDDGGADLYLHARQMQSLWHGDRILAEVVGIDRRGRREGRLTEVLERAVEQVMGRFFVEREVGYVLPADRRTRRDILIPPDCRMGARPDQMVRVEIIEQPTRRHAPLGRVVEILGDHMAPGLEIDIAIHTFGLPNAWPEAVAQTVAALPAEVEAHEKEGRVDLRALPLVTIDDASAQDFDDAVWCERRKKGWRLLVAIADVSHYAHPDTPLDEEARRRGTSVYFPERTLPMLPEPLSNGLCSLRPEVDRLCMVCEIDFDDAGAIRRSRLFSAVMRSAARLTYVEAAAWLDGAEPPPERRPLAPLLREMQALYRVLRAARTQRGAIDFETAATKIEFGAGRKIERIVAVERNDAHRMIEEFMIAANVCAADFLIRRQLPTLHRVHEPPPMEKREDVREFLRDFGLQLRGGDEPISADYAEVLKQARDRPEFDLIQTVLLRGMSRAHYSPEPLGHFGLAHAHYAHFTSPIRRYPDLLVHRAIRHALSKAPAADFLYAKGDMERLGAHCSTTERRADDAVRDVEEWLKCEYMRDRVGDEFSGIVSGVVSFGLFITLDGLHVEGLLHITALENDYYHFDPTRRQLVGERAQRTYRLGDPLRVRVTRVDLDERKIDFELAPGAAAGAKKGRPGAAKKKGARRQRRGAAK